MDTEKKIKAGDIRAASRLIRHIEDSLPEARATLKRIFPFTGNAHVVGITGAPGAGKSTLVDGLIASYRKQDRKVGVLAVDPTSPFTGGAILGDRIRMQRHAEDPGVFVRSLATRGALGGLSKAVGDAIHVMDAMGKDIVMIETVGTGQQEVDIVNHAHTVVLVLVPGMGDEIQAIKAGIMEIADIFVINKADREGAGKLEQELSALLEMSSRSGAKGGRLPRIVRVGNAMNPAEFDNDIEALSGIIRDHFDHLVRSDLMGDRLRRKTRHELNEALRESILEPVLEKLIGSGEFDRMIERLIRRESDPYTLAEEVAKKFLKTGED